MHTILLVALLMHADKNLKATIVGLVAKRPDSKTVEEASKIETRIAELLDANDSYIRWFCKRYVVGFRDEWELGTANSVLLRMGSTHVVAAEAAASVLRSDRISIHYKRTACSVLAKHGGAMRPRDVKKLFDGLSAPVATTLSCELILHMYRFSAQDRLEVLRLALEISKTEGADERRSVLDAVTEGIKEKGNETLFREGLKEFKEPHHKALLLIALLGLNPKESKDLAAELQKIIAGDKLSRWYYERNVEVKRWYDETFKMPKKGKE